MKKRGKLIVIEGADGTGKATQTRLLVQHLRNLGFKVVSQPFPEYRTQTGKEVKSHLTGKYGDPIELDSYFSACFFIQDRFKAKNRLLKILESYDFLVLDRYVSSNMGHQGAKLASQRKILNFAIWEEKVEYNQLGLPRPDLVILLRTPWQLTQQMMAKKTKDFLESSAAYQKKVWQSYNLLAKHYRWPIIASTGKQGQLMKPSKIAKIIYKKVSQAFNL